MILPDVNLLVYAYLREAPWHEPARAWWEECLSGQQTIGLAWAVVLGYVRLMSSPEVVQRPIPPADALEDVRAWLARPQVQILQPGGRHVDIMQELLRRSAAASRLTTDCHLAALAIELQAELHSNDADFARFPGLRWRNPLRG